MNIPLLKNGIVRTPVVMQMQATECGAACLTSILAHFGYWIELRELSQKMAINRDGANLLQIKSTAVTFNLKAQGKMATKRQLRKLKPPFIAHWDKNHFVVVEGFHRGKIHINNPAVGRQVISTDELDRHYSGICLMLEPDTDFEPHGKRPSSTRQLLALFQGNQQTALIIAGYALLMTIPGLTLAAALKSFVDDILIQQTNTWILPLILLLVLAAVLNAIFIYQQNRYLLKLETKLTARISGNFFMHLMKLPMQYFNQRSAGDLMSRLASCHNISALLAGPFSLAFAHMISAAVYAAVMFSMDVKLALAALAITFLNIALVWSTQNLRSEKSAAMLSHQATLAGVSVSALHAAETLKATGSESDFITHQWMREEIQAINASQIMGRTSQYLNTAPGLAHTISIACILGFGSALIIGSNLSIGILLGFQTLMGQFANSIQSVISLAAGIQQSTADLQRFNDVTEVDIDTRNHIPEPTAPDRLSGTLNVDQLAFRYTENSPWVLQNIHFSVAPGERVALVGGSGSGKSTLARILLGLEQPDHGCITIGDRNLADIDNATLSASIASVDQDIFLFEGSISNNLTLWDSSLPMQTVIQAAKDACIHDDIIRRPGGYQAHIAERGANFSGGQCQRLEIARALTRTPSVLILDEATAALDALTERRIDNNLRKRAISCLIIAHRLSTIKDCDQILVLDNGTLVERGSHDQLIALNGHYAALVKSQ
ncbi:Lactococcin-G-processing and transport ATP-binding protein LagD [BD1-7 clade bacterium]|uniref:Lactococcin-G-processing and transport ATP-binding protein LagD n=1 Tax=BD1-7 clade bacterium TaxID=2029982 RepID=A0A5S9P478_9GAMM|nr:Lactococcin-G-processing and transport ATP-binding protein LagD [BD1-7 clade bacterium]CAA0098202.1 Lactococcin-G-processing and transport ATP-binding protein LagD [BD1-7 clade bacterium]